MFEVRQLDAADAADYRDIRLEALEACPESFGSSHAEDAGLPLVRFREIVSENVVFGGFQGPVLQGVVGF
ncbi:MAG TPA: GNAT family N-acetyltransferase, partial [Alphaproteobacteria bacterium]